MQISWIKFDEQSPPINQYILISNINSKSNSCCPAVKTINESYIFISCNGCKWITPSEPYTHWCLVPNELLKTCDGCNKNYLHHICDRNVDAHRSCSRQNMYGLQIEKDKQLQIIEMEVTAETERQKIKIAKAIVYFIIGCLAINFIKNIVSPFIKTELEFRYKKKYIKMYKEELKEEVKEISKFSVDSVKDIIKELKK
jgi:hypothetical protein